MLFVHCSLLKQFNSTSPNLLYINTLYTQKHFIHIKIHVSQSLENVHQTTSINVQSFSNTNIPVHSLTKFVSFAIAINTHLRNVPFLSVKLHWFISNIHIMTLIKGVNEIRCHLFQHNMMFCLGILRSSFHKRQIHVKLQSSWRWW